MKLHETIKKYTSTVVNACKLITEADVKRDEGISYRKLGNCKEEMESEKNGKKVIYLGKKFKEQIWKEALYLGIGCKIDDTIYNREFLQATLAYTLSNTPPGETLRIVIGRVLSELFNGEADILEQTYKLDEQKRLIANLANSVEYENHRLKIVSMDEMPQNQGLFKRLRECIDTETRVVDVKKAYACDEQPKISEQSDALEIAQFLYFATHKIPELKKIFFKMRPSKIREKTYNEASNYYGLTEIAIRLREILSGNYIHIGADRQAVYDEIIDKMMHGRNSKGKFSTFKELYPLYDLLEKRAFHTVHVKKQNFCEKIVQKNCLFTRLCIYGTLAAWSLLGMKIAINQFYSKKEIDSFQFMQKAELLDDDHQENKQSLN